MRLDSNQTEQRYEQRTIAYRAAVIDESEHGVLDGAASQVGVMDAYNSVIAPGAFDGCIPEFLRSGHVCFNHDSSRWIGMPTAARMEGRLLRVSAEFYSDEFSQSIRSKIQERHAKHKTTDFSIGFRPNWDKTEYFDSGEKLWTYAVGLGIDMSLMDTSIRQHQGFCWLISDISELIEWGPVTAGATPGAAALGVRHINDLRDGSRAETSLENHLDLALAAVQGALGRFGAYADVRSSDGRAVSPNRLAQAEALASSLQQLIGKCRASDPNWNRLCLEIDSVLTGM